MLKNDSPAWLAYSKHVLKWEGGTSSDPRDTASSCFPGGIHTNKGVTFCTFKQMAATLGITPVTHQRFLSLTDAEIAKFQFRFYEAVNGSKFPDSIALLMTEAAWGSGPNRAWRHLYDALADCGVNARTKAPAIEAANKVSEKNLFEAYHKRRLTFLVETLGGQPKFAMYRNGWRNRQMAFYNLFVSLAK